MAQLSWMLAGLLTVLCAAAGAEHHYIFFNRDREKIAEPAFLRTAALDGAQLKYTWRELEPRQDAYDFAPIGRDLEFLQSKGKRLFVQLQDVSFDSSIVNVPQYLRDDDRYHGGIARQIDSEGGGPAVPAGWVARRWDPAVRERFHKLLAALGQEFDGRIEGIVLPETSIEFGEDARRFPPGFTHQDYRNSVIDNMAALKRAFPKSVAMQYTNFMPGEWLPGDDKGYLRAVYEAGRKLGVGMGGPDLLPYRKGQLDHAYPLLRQSAGTVPTGIAVQDGNYEHRNPKTGRPVSIAELRDFAAGNLRVDYIFWSAQEPFYSRDVLPFLALLARPRAIDYKK
jgi:hypothetical protein